MSRKQTLRRGSGRHRNTKALLLAPARNNRAVDWGVETPRRFDCAYCDTARRLRRHTVWRYRSYGTARHRAKPRTLRYARRIVFHTHPLLTRPVRWWNDNLHTAYSS